MDAAALAELVAPADAPLAAPEDALPGNEAPVVPIVDDDAPDEATPDAPPNEEVTGDVAPGDTMLEEEVPADEAPEAVPDDATPTNVPVDVAPWALLDEVAPDDADEVLAPKLLGSSTITGLLCAEAAELAEDEEDIRGEAIGPRLDANGVGA